MPIFSWRIITMKKVKLILILLNIIPVLLLCVGVGLFVLTNRIEESFGENWLYIILVVIMWILIAGYPFYGIGSISTNIILSIIELRKNVITKPFFIINVAIVALNLLFLVLILLAMVYHIGPLYDFL